MTAADEALVRGFAMKRQCLITILVISLSPRARRAYRAAG